MAEKISAKYKKNYKNEYNTLYEAVFGEPNREDEEFGSTSYEESHEPICEAKFDFQTSPTNSESEEWNETSWSNLPDLLLENIFSYLTMQERYYSSLVCRSWYRCFYLPNSWRTFVFDDKTLTRSLFNYYSGWQYILDHLRAQCCLNTIGTYIKTLIFKPISNFYNLYEFMNMISFYAEQENNAHCNVKGVGSHITSLQYTFPCNMASRNETRLYGTGGKLLDALKRLMGNLPSLQNLTLIDLMLDLNEAQQLLDQVCYTHCLTMNKLILVNVSKIQCPLLHVGVFLNLQKLVISPQNLGDDVVNLLAETSLRHLHIVQNSYTPTDVIPVSRTTWLMCKQRNPHLQVHLHVYSNKNQILIWQEAASVYTILFDSPQSTVKVEDIVRVTNNYRKTLQIFGHLGLPRYYQPKSLHERIDSHLLYLCYNCPNLHTLAIRERVSTATLLLISYFAKNLKFLYVRRNAVIKRSDWPRNPEWSKELYDRIKMVSRSYEQTEAEISFLMGYKWKMFSDKEFKLLSLKMNF